MSRPRALIVCPGRGSYGRDDLGSLQGDLGAGSAVVEACDAWRKARGRVAVSELDGAERYSATRHVAGEHASLLTFAASLVDLARLDPDRYDIVGVTGNSMGWYTALAATGALSLPHAIELVDTMGTYQLDNVIGGQVMMPVTDDDWAPDPTLRAAVDEAIGAVRAAGAAASISIELGSFVVIGADGPGVKLLLRELPEQTRGSRRFPAQLPLHSAFHTPLLAETAEQAQRDLAHLEFRTPHVPLYCGHGHTHRPWSADPERLRAYTLGTQVTETYDFAAALRVALRSCAPDVVIALGPGNSLGGPIAWGLLREGWHGVTARREVRERSLLRSFGVPDQRSELVA